MISNIGAILKNLLFILSSGYILVFFSEHLFWAHIRVDDSLPNWISTWIAYSLLAYVLLWVISTFRVRTIHPLFLAGAVFGWLTEGLVVQTTYESLPLSISFTGLAWHALISVVLGWYLVRRALHTHRSSHVLRLACLIGLGYGVWAISWWLEPGETVSSIAEFAGFTFSISALAATAYWVADWSASASLRWNRWVMAGIAACFILYFGFVTVPAAPVALGVLPVLLGLAGWGLWKNRASQPEGSLLVPPPGRVPLRSYLALLGLPISAVAVYALAYGTNLRLQTNWVLYLITTPLGFLWFGYALYQAVRPTRPDHPS
jgi:hypothetical protein